MKILDFIDNTDLKKKNECEKAELICYFQYKENGDEIFHANIIGELFAQFGFSSPNF